MQNMNAVRNSSCNLHKVWGGSSIQCPVCLCVSQQPCRPGARASARSGSSRKRTLIVRVRDGNQRRPCGCCLVRIFPQAKLKRSPAPAAGCGTSLTHHVHLKYSKQRDPQDKPTVQSKTRTHKKPIARVTDQSPSVSGGNGIAGETIYDHRLELSL